MEENKLVIDFLKNPGNYYLGNGDNMSVGNNPNITNDDVVFIKIKQITFEDEAPRKEAIENVLSTLRFPGVNTIYMIRGERTRVSFYYGIVRNKVLADENTAIKDIGISVLKKSIEGNFRGSKVEVVTDDETSELINFLKLSKNISSICGVPGINAEEATNFQGVDRLIDTMLGDNFLFVVTAMHLSLSAINDIENNICGFYDNLVPLSKNSEQSSQSVSKNIQTSKGINSSESTSNQNSETKGSSKSTTSNLTKGKSQTGGSESTNESKTFGKSDSKTKGLSETNSESSGKSNSKTFSFEHSNKQAQDWMKYVDETLLPRLDYGKGKGLFVVNVTLFANNDLVQRKLENTATSLFSGEKGNKAPLQITKLNPGSQREVNSRNLQIPLAHFVHKIDANEVLARSALSQYVTSEKGFWGNWMSVKELGVIAGLPRKEVIGLSLSEEVEFGLNINSEQKEQKQRIDIGHLVHSGIVKKDICISLDRKALDKHIFVCGVTGCGKTTTCMGLLQQSKMPYLVIEPAKTEYRILTNDNPDVLVFTLGKDGVAPFRFNPLEFLPNETISSHVDMVKASIEAAFDMEAAIPQIIESALYKSYENYGWDVSTDKNTIHANPFADGVFAFPTLSDLINNTKVVVDEQGFDDRLKNDYIGSIKARLQGLLVGAKGLMLNTPRSVDFCDLLHKKVILELEDIKSGTEKSLIMGFILTALSQAIKVEYAKNKNFKHLTLVEEAHRLLSKYVPGDSLSKKNGVETFSDMLAEVRKYGEGLIIADQIPEKMAPDVLKNTNTKIVHKIFAQDDKEAIGNTMALTDEQKQFLSSLSVGRAVVFSQGWEKSVQVQINQLNDTTKSVADEKRLRMLALNYYVNNYSRGVFPEMGCMSAMPSVSKFSEILSDISSFKQLKSTFCIFVKKKTEICASDFNGFLCICGRYMSDEEIAVYLNNSCIKNADKQSEELLLSLIMEVKAGLTSIKTGEKLVQYEKLINSIKNL